MPVPVGLGKLMQTLDGLMLATGTDKASTGHGYSLHYGELFAPLQHEPVVLFEIGVWEGASLHAWARYFDHADSHLFGFDCDTWRYKHLDDPRANVITADATTETFGHMMEVMPRPTIVIDDGSHREIDHRATFAILWPRLQSGGFYCIEDLHTYYWERANPSGADAWLMEMVRDCLGRGVEQARPEVARVWVWPSLVVLQKQ